MPPQAIEHGPQGIPTWGLLALSIPIIMIFAGMSLGFSALKDIRLANGSLGGAMMATFAAGLLPAVVIVVICGFGLNELAVAILPNPRPRNDGLMNDPDAWGFAGAISGVWISFLMLRGMNRRATGWLNPVTGDQEGARSGLATAAIVLTIVGVAVALFVMATMRRSSYGARQEILIAELMILVAGTVCGVLTRHEPAGKPCAWICGLLFIFLLLLAAA